MVEFVLLLRRANESDRRVSFGRYWWKVRDGCRQTRRFEMYENELVSEESKTLRDKMSRPSVIVKPAGEREETTH